MRATISRSFVESKINAYTISFKNEKPVVKELEPVTVLGKVSQEKALKELKKVYGAKCPVSVSKIEESEKQYEIAVEDFIKYAKLVEKTKTEEKEVK